MIPNETRTGRRVNGVDKWWASLDYSDITMGCPLAAPLFPPEKNLFFLSFLSFMSAVERIGDLLLRETGRHLRRPGKVETDRIVWRYCPW
ncbi:hypothetical protein [Shinella granuli]|uniref:hypothetical protein n=1 Tax=Shinella granuli TaxID=323621 RepID=UPI001055EB6A|nr:hypothetical protein [Shinella granuli]